MRKLVGIAAVVLAGSTALTGAAATAAPTPHSSSHPRCELPQYGPGADYRPQIDPSRFGPHVDNPWFPLRPGTTYLYAGSEDGASLVDIFAPSRRTKVIDGVRTRVVHDRLLTDGVLTERTTDYHAQDVCGNVWYFGEDTAELDEHGKVTSHAARGARVWPVRSPECSCRPIPSWGGPSGRNGRPVSPRTSSPRSRATPGRTCPTAASTAHCGRMRRPPSSPESWTRSCTCEAWARCWSRPSGAAPRNSSWSTSCADNGTARYWAGR